MVAVVSGNGLGLLNGSLSQLGLISGGAAGLGQSRDLQYLNAANGNLVLQGADSALVFNGISLSDLRTYNSEGGGTGQGWLWGFSRNVFGLTGTVNTAGSTIKRTAEDGSVLTYTYDSSIGSYRAAGEAGTRDALKWDPSTVRWTWTDTDSRRQEMYNANGTLVSASDPLTGGSYTLAYTNQLLTSITAADGDVLTFGYDAQGRVTSLSTKEVPAGGGAAVTRTAVTYGYDALGRLTTVTTSLDSDSQASTSSFTSTYEYDGTSNRISRLTQSDGVAVAYAYTQGADSIWRVTTITTGSGSEASVQTIAYATVVEQGVTLNATTITDASGRGWTYKSDVSGRLVAVVSPAVNGQRQTTTYTYDANNNVTSVTDALGNKTAYGYDALGNRTSEQDQLGNTITRTYSSTNQLLTETTYRTATPGATPTSSSTPETVRYVYENDRLRFVIDAKGDVTENQYDSVGKLVMTRQFVGAKYAGGCCSVERCGRYAGRRRYAAATPNTHANNEYTVPS
ncbi:RHS repeat protein [Luteibacter sp. 22Crub2.1]|uniref:RHS repeat protein n=1 Tax=Luteibacter sp. 22Crub2.1 TaxID=1283288 RepID=UPI0009A90604|nr:RHS repeat protein [Luteibacter sp. 22Crub2.1]SKC03827.1 YD repeat-containing protein [Luteibacter sp. 22Crub2.1]